MTQETALTILKTGSNVFLTGDPGSGKTYLVNKYAEYLRSHGIEPAITASTGIAATHIGGLTIHSWSGIGIKKQLTANELAKIAANDYVEKRVLATKVLIIDEISMLPAETLQSVEAICRLIKKNSKSFGGMQVVLCGDFFQLPPVVNYLAENNQQGGFFEQQPAHFAYDSPVWNSAGFLSCYLQEQFRHDDIDLVKILSKIRKNGFDDISLEIIKERKIELTKAPLQAPKLFSHNVDVDRENNRLLEKIPAKPRLYEMKTKGNPALVAVMKKGCLSPGTLRLKVGAAVMFTKNSPKDGFVNGTLGVVEKFDSDSCLPVVKTRNGRKIIVSPAEWTVEENGKIKALLRQIPLRLAWAITVHKSQGISLDEAIIDLSQVFEFGQGYVAISRVRKLSGIYLLGWNEMAFRVNPEVAKRDREFFRQSQEIESRFSKIPIGRLETMSKEFIFSCDGSVNIIDIAGRKKKQKLSTYDATLNLWKEGKNIKQIAEIRNLSEETILSHIEKSAERGKIGQAELFRIIPLDFISEMEKVQQAFLVLETTRLSPVFDYFRGQYSYIELRIARMLIE